MKTVSFYFRFCIGPGIRGLPRTKSLIYQIFEVKKQIDGLKFEKLKIKLVLESENC